MEEHAQRLLLATIGHTVEPVELAIEVHAPTRVALIASETSIGAARAVLAWRGFTEDVWVVDDPESLAAAYRVVRTNLSALYRTVDVAALIVDVTGGTKAMATGVALACRGLGASYSYVGGTHRDTVGRVITGSERVRLLDDPTDVEADAALWTLRHAWRVHAYAFGAAIAERAAHAALRQAERAFLEAMVVVCSGMAAWDAGDHASARATLPEAVDAAYAAAVRLRHGEKARTMLALRGYAAELDDLAAGSLNAVIGDALRGAQRRREVRQRFDALLRLRWAAERVAAASPHEATLRSWLERCASATPHEVSDDDLAAGFTALAALGWRPAPERPGW